MEQIRRHRVRDQVRDRIRDRIVAREFDTGYRLDEIGLAKNIGASRTPVREALIALEEEGLVLSRPNHGFVVAPRDAALVRQIYPVLGALERAAIEAGGKQLKALAPKLAAINAQIALETHKVRRYELDRQFHHTLTSACGNPLLLRLLEMHWNQAQRIDGGHDRGMADPQGSHDDHGQIVAAIEAGLPGKAAELLHRHWSNGERVVLDWMKER